jgi:hypothetical protein
MLYELTFSDLWSILGNALSCKSMVQAYNQVYFWTYKLQPLRWWQYVPLKHRYPHTEQNYMVSQPRTPQHIFPIYGFILQCCLRFSWQWIWKLLSFETRHNLLPYIPAERQFSTKLEGITSQLTVISAHHSCVLIKHYSVKMYGGVDA